MLACHKIHNAVKLLFIFSVISFIISQYTPNLCNLFTSNPYFAAKEEIHEGYRRGIQELDLKSSILISLGFGTSISIVGYSRKKLHKYT